MNEAWVKCRLFDDMHGLMIILILVWRKSINFWRRYVQKTIFTF